ncbi:MAG: SGNH/GDSL hydrolase family protein [Oceanidesulfovibrio sp.]
MKSLLRAFWLLLKWGIIAVLLVEVVSFAVITVSNLMIYGVLREGSKVRYDPYALFLNMEGPKPTAPQPESPRYTVWCFGGSTMRGQTDDPAATIPSLLARRLNGRAGHAVALSNWGEDSFNSLLEANYLQKLLIERGDGADLILFYDGANDSVYFSQYRDPYGHHGYRRLKGLIESYHGTFLGIFKSLNAAARASFTRELVDKFRQVVSTIEPDDPALHIFAALVEQRYDQLALQARQRGDAFLVVWQPVLWAENAPVADAVRKMEQDYLVNDERFAALNGNFRLVYETLRGRLADKPYFVDLRNALADRTMEAYQPDGVHLTDAGRDMVASRLAPLVQQLMQRNAGATTPPATPGQDAGQDAAPAPWEPAPAQ